MATRSRAGRQALTTRLIVVTGVSGSGRASVLRVLEDLGLYCVDNLPVALAPEVVRLAIAHDPNLKGIALGIDPRERMFFPQWPSIFAELERDGIRPEVVFTDASDEVLARRYSESRRPHPMAEEGQSVADSIRRERLALAEMRERASRVIDTTTLTVHELREVVTAYVMGAGGGASMAVMLVSFGYKYGLPVGLDLVLDARFIPNPFFVPELRASDGLEPKVRDYVLGQAEARRFIDEIVRLLEFLLPLYQREGKSYLTIGIGCTGGRHRSPALVSALQERLASTGVEAQASHHDLARAD
ncbi:MAG TPA: RNase adapter RapZ [Candidatus Binataceae bacterium]|nr:RNase adapter RapZ [Candidatus Binataceae bacterium]